jgi:hypothetical protein
MFSIKRRLKKRTPQGAAVQKNFFYNRSQFLSQPEAIMLEFLVAQEISVPRPQTAPRDVRRVIQLGIA